MTPIEKRDCYRQRKWGPAPARRPGMCEFGPLLDGGQATFARDSRLDRPPSDSQNERVIIPIPRGVGGVLGG